MAIKFTRLDLNFILTQIEMAEAGQPPVNPLLSFGLREVAGTNNNLVAGQSTFGATDQVFPTTTDPLLQNAQAGTSYASTSGLVVDAQPRLISNLISDQTANNPAALAAQAQQAARLGAGYQNSTLAGPDGVLGTADDVGTTFAGPDGVLGTADDITTFGNLATPLSSSSSSSTVPGLAPSLFINNITPDNGLSAPANSWFTFFGQFFDHGLDMINKSGTSGTVFIPLAKDDPLYVVGGHSNFMVLTRAANLPGADGILGTADDVHQATNQTSPFVDQSQTYASDPSHQVFLRQYMIGADGKLHSTGALLGHAKADGKDGMATWADLKANAAQFLGIQLTDADVGTVPLLATDAYGNFLPGANGLPQLVVRNADGTTSLVEGNLAHPISTVKAVLTGHAFLNDMAHAASPTDDFGNPLTRSDTVAVGGTPPAGSYDGKLLDAHFMGGDGRVNENIGLTAVQDLFHSEHDRLLALTKATVQAELDKGDVSFAGNWVLAGVDLTLLNGVAADGVTLVHVIAANEWNGERLFQAAKFGTETEYQHIVFDEFARYVAPSIHVAGPVNVHIDPAITSEFANVVYRFGHSMLDENVNLYVLGADGKPVINPATGQPTMTQEGLIAAFTNPLKFASDPNMTADIVLGTVNQVSNSIDEFVTGSLRNNLLGLPLDLPALNIARGRDTGVAPLNLVRNQLFSQTGEAQLKAYANWAEFGSQLKHPESLINFVAAYGTHGSITSIIDAVTGLPRPTTMAERRTAATALVHKGTLGDPAFNPADAASVDAYNFMHSQGAYASNRLDARAIHTAAQPGVDGVLGTADDIAGVPANWSTGSVTGVDSIDMWVGGLAEKISLFGGVLGSTFEFVFRTQLEALQDGDRLYYVPRIEGTDYEESLQDSSLAQLIRVNTDIKHLPGNIFLTPEYTIESSNYFQTNLDGSFKLDANGNHIATTDTSKWLHNPQTGQVLVNVTPDGTVEFLGDDNFLGNTIVLGGTEGNDKLTAGAADDDTVWGDGGNDVINGGGGNDFLFGGTGNDTVIGGQGDDTIHGDEGNDTIFGGDGADIIFGGDGNDYIEDGRGNDVVLGGLGNDIIIANEGSDELAGGQGDDWLESRGGQGQLMFGDSGAPTGGVPLYSGNDVMIGGVAGGDVMKGFSGDDIMVGGGSFTKFNGGLGFDWGSYESAAHGVDEDMNRKEFIAANGAEDTIRDVWQQTEGASGSAFNDNITGTNDSKLTLTKDQLDNVNLINGLQSFFAPGVVSFEGGNIILGGGGNDTITGGGGTDIIDGDAWLHVALTSYTAGAQIIRQIAFDPNGNTFDPLTGLGHANAANVDTAVFNDNMANYNIALFGPDAQGFLTIEHVVGGAGAVGTVDDGTDRIRNIERLQFADATVAIDSQGNILSSTASRVLNAATPGYDTVPLGTPTITESGGLNPLTTVTVGQTLTASVAGITDADGISTPFTFQWQMLDLARGVWLNIVGATSSTFIPTAFQTGALGLRVQASYTDGLGYKETVVSAQTAVVTLPGNINTAPTIVFGQQFNGISNTTSLFGAPFDFFSPFTSIFTDNQTAANALIYKATLADGSSLASVGMTFTFNPVTGAGEFNAPNGFIDPNGNLVAAGQLGVRVTATDAGPGVPLSVTNTFFINILPLDTPPVANNDAYSILENASLSVATVRQGVLANDTDADVGDRLTAQLVSGPAHGALQFNKDGTFNYTPTLNYSGPDSFTYLANDTFLASSNTATVTITVTPLPHTLTEALAVDSGASATDLITNNPALVGKGSSNTAVFASIDGGPAIQVGIGNATGGWNFTPVLADGLHTVVVTETNAAGQTDTASLTFTLDTTPPAVTVALTADTGVLANDGITNNPALTGVSSPNATVVVRIDGGPGVTLNTNALGVYTLNPVGLADGLHTVAVSGSTDIAGNTGAAALSFTLDTTAPAAPVIVGFTYNSTGTALTNYTVFGTAEANSTVTIGNGGAAALGNAIAGANGAWSFQIVPNPSNNFTTTLTATTTDLAGNVSSGSSAGVSVGRADFNALTAPVAAGPNLILGLGDNDVLIGGAGNDILDGGTGIDIMLGLGGNDTYVVDNAGDVVSELPNSGIDTVLTTLGAYSLSANVENLTYTGAGNFNGTGNNLANVVTGGAGADTISGGANIAGVDTLIGGGGNDTYNVSNVGDVVVELAGGGTDTVRTALGSYLLDANVENLTFTGVGSFTGTGNALANVITGGTGADILDGGKNVTGVDTLIGGAGNDTYIVRNAGDVVSELSTGGTDTVLSVINSYTLATNVESLSFIGSGAFTGVGNRLSNTITGGAGDDRLDGGLGNDTLIGGAGADTLIGGGGSDTFVLAKGDANGDLIADFTRNGANGTDRISFTGYGAGASLVKQVVGSIAQPTSYAVQVGGITQDTFKLTGNVTLIANDYKFA